MTSVTERSARYGWEWRRGECLLEIRKRKFLRNVPHEWLVGAEKVSERCSSRRSHLGRSECCRGVRFFFQGPGSL